MAFEQDITELVQASDRLTGVVEGKISDIDSKVQQAQTQVDDYIATARGETPYYRISKNQALAGTDGHVPDFWHSGEGITYTLVQSVNDSVDWVDRTPEEQELLTAMNSTNTRYVSVPFNIWRMDWTLADHTHTLYQRVNAPVPITVAAMTKLISGSTYASWAQGVTNEWTLTGVHEGLTPHRYSHIHPYRTSATGSMLFALPAAIAGHIPLDAKNWSLFPYIGDTQND